MKIEYDGLYRSYVVWKVDQNSLIEVFRGSLKNCKEFVKNKARRKNR